MATKLYDLVIRARKSFSIILTDFTQSESWTILFRQKNVVSYIVRETKKMFATLTQRGTRLVISVVRFTEKPTLSTSNKVNLSFILKQTQKFIITKTSNSVLNFAMKMNSYFTNILISNFNFSLSLSPLLAEFIPLGDWDGSALGSMDTLTLAETDYVEA